MNRILTAATTIGLLLCLTVQAGKHVVPLTLVANGTNYASAAVTAVAPDTTNWCELVGMYICVPKKGEALIDVITHVYGTNCVLNTQAVRNMSAITEVWLLTPRRGMWPSANPAVDKYPLWSTNTIIRVRPTIYTTNAYDSVKNITTQAVDMVTTLSRTNSWAIQLIVDQ